MALSGIGIGYNPYGNTYSTQTKRAEEKALEAIQKNSAVATGNNDYFNELSNSVKAAKLLLHEAKSKMSSAENREATPQEEMTAAIASLM